MKYNIGAKLKKIRLNLGLNQSQMGNLLYLTQNAYSRLETNNVNVLFEQIIDIAYQTNIGVYEFFPDDLTEIQQINFRMQMQDYYNEIQSLKKEVAYQRDLNIELLKRIKFLNEELSDLGITPPPPAKFELHLRQKFINT
jgi:transcriptional regulator with XRE-family HTH domain